MDARKPALAGQDHRDGHIDQISGPWFEVLDEGADPPDDPDAVEDVDYVYLQNNAAQPTAGAGLDGDDLEEFSFRRGISRLDFKGCLDVSSFVSGDTATTIPAAYRLSKDDFFYTLVLSGGSLIAAMVYIFGSTSARAGEVTITFPVS